MIFKNSKAINILYHGLRIEICELVFHCKSTKEIRDYLYYLNAINEKVTDYDMIEQEDTIKTKESVNRKVGDDTSFLKLIINIF